MSVLAFYLFLEKRDSVAHLIFINYHWSFHYAFFCRLCSIHYTAVWFNNCSKSTSAIEVATMKNTNVTSIMKGSHHVQQPNQHFSLSAKMNGTQRRTPISPWRMHCTYCGMPNGTCQGEAMLNSQNIKPVAIAVIEFYACLKVSGMQTGSQSVSQ